MLKSVLLEFGDKPEPVGCSMGADRVEFEWKEWENMVDQQVMCRSDLLGSGLMQNIVAKKFGLEGRSILWKVVNMS